MLSGPRSRNSRIELRRLLRRRIRLGRVSRITCKIVSVVQLMPRETDSKDWRLVAILRVKLTICAIDVVVYYHEVSVFNPTSRPNNTTLFNNNA